MELAVAIVVFALTVLGQFLLTRILLSISAVLKYLLLSMLGALGLWAILSRIVQADLFTRIACLVLYGFLCELYLFLFTLVSASVSVTLLRTLQRRGDLRFMDVERLYDSEGMVSKRWQRLRFVGLIHQDRQEVTPRGRRLVWLFGLLKKTFRHHLESGQPTARKAM